MARTFEYKFNQVLGFTESFGKGDLDLVGIGQKITPTVKAANVQNWQIQVENEHCRLIDVASSNNTDSEGSSPWADSILGNISYEEMDEFDPNEAEIASGPRESDAGDKSTTSSTSTIEEDELFPAKISDSLRCKLRSIGAEFDWHINGDLPNLVAPAEQSVISPTQLVQPIESVNEVIPPVHSLLQQQFQDTNNDNTSQVNTEILNETGKGGQASVTSSPQMSIHEIAMRKCEETLEFAKKWLLPFDFHGIDRRN